MHVMARETWTDDRLAELAKRTDEGFSEVRTELRHQRAEMVRQKEVDAKFDAQQKYMDGRFEAQQKYMDGRFEALNRTMQVGFGLIGSFLGVIGILIAT